MNPLNATHVQRRRFHMNFNQNCIRTKSLHAIDGAKGGSVGCIHWYRTRSEIGDERREEVGRGCKRNLLKYILHTRTQLADLFFSQPSNFGSVCASIRCRTFMHECIYCMYTHPLCRHCINMTTALVDYNQFRAHNNNAFARAKRRMENGKRRIVGTKKRGCQCANVKK